MTFIKAITCGINKYIYAEGVQQAGRQRHPILIFMLSNISHNDATTKNLYC